jgi:succinylglutamic semialdehyde dehydrogenase
MNGSFAPLDFKGNFIAGRFVKPRGGRRWTVEDPGDLDHPVGEAVEDVPAVDRAVAAARRAWGPWRALPLEKRLDFLRRYQEGLRQRKADLAWVMSRETGKLLAESLAEADAMAAKVDLTAVEGAALVGTRTFPLDGAEGSIVWKPRGVVGILGPFNVPGHLPNGQLVPALLFGGTVVFKPSELTPFTGQVMAEIMEAAGFPPGVVNVVFGGGRTGAALAKNREVAVLFFTGSAETGARVARAGASVPGRLTALEMGGKNAALVLPDADLTTAVEQILHGAFSTSGQRCSCTSRVLIHRDVADGFLNLFLPRVENLRAGYFTEKADLGPLVRATAVKGFMAAEGIARGLGFKTLCPPRRTAASRRGHYVLPAVRVRRGRRGWMKPGAPYWDRELFAPDVAVVALSSEREMAAVNNAGSFGLVASVFTGSKSRFENLRRDLDNGVVHWNRSTAMTPGRLPFGGVKASGNHWPAGLFAPYACVYPVGSVESPPR